MIERQIVCFHLPLEIGVNWFFFNFSLRFCLFLLFALVNGMKTLFFKCVSFLLSETRKDMVAIKFKPPVQGAANLKGGGMWGKWCDGVCLLLWWR